MTVENLSSIRGTILKTVDLHSRLRAFAAVETLQRHRGDHPKETGDRPRKRPVLSTGPPLRIPRRPKDISNPPRRVGPVVDLPAVVAADLVAAALPERGARRRRSESLQIRPRKFLAEFSRRSKSRSRKLFLPQLRSLHLRNSKRSFVTDIHTRSTRRVGTRYVEGTLTVAEKPRRSLKSQSEAGGADRKITDDGGHYIAARFNGPTYDFNHFAQDAKFNRGKYRLLEAEWGRAKRE